MSQGPSKRPGCLLRVRCFLGVAAGNLNGPTRTAADGGRKKPAPEVSVASFHAGFASGAVSVYYCSPHLAIEPADSYKRRITLQLDPHL